MLAITRLIVLLLIIILFAVQCSQSDQLDNLEEKVDKIYDATCLYATRINLQDSQETL